VNRLIDVPLELLDDGPNVRVADAGMRGSIALFGVLQAISVCERDGRYEVLYGHRRVAAARSLDLATIPAIVEPAPANRAVRQVVENLHRREMSPVDIAKVLRAHLDANPGMTMTALGRLIGRSVVYVSHKLELLEMEADVIDQVDRGLLGAETAIRRRRAVVHHAVGRPRDIPLPDELGRARSVVVPLGEDSGARQAVISVNRETREVELVVSAGDRSVVLTLAPAEAKLLGRRLTQAYEALA
jgi:ParB/RepB/Spo0J family partition protein